jgi:hypothetical protein
VNSRRAALLVAALAWASAAQAEPRFAARFGFPCAVCHVNPSGGGLRTAYARDVFEKQQLTFGPGADSQPGVDFDPRLSDRLTFGGDFRLAMIWQPKVSSTNPEPTPAQTLFRVPPTPTKFTFFPMQVDFYVGAEISRHVTLSTDVGANGSFEAFGLVHDLPLGTYIKAGYFIPPYGTKLPNHTAAHRQPIGFEPTGKDAGVEIGIVRPWVDAQVAVQNGQLGSTLDNAYRPALSARLALIHDFGPFKATAGPSFRWNPSDVQGPADAQGKRPTLTSVEVQEGGFLWLSMGRLTYIGEADVHIKDDATQLNAQGRATRSGQFVSYNELMFLLARGVDAGVTWEFMDRDIYAGGDALHRFGIQGSIFPAAFTEIQAFVRFYKPVFKPTASEPRRAEAGQWEIIAFLHLFF